ncbi:flippase [candidate division KSB1 bacterium]|nr:flippase [candidate division KSB1 bacterium]
MNTSRRIAGNLFYLFAGEFFSSGLAFLSAVYLARILTDEGFGYWAFVQSIVLYLALVVDLGLSTFGAREIAHNRERAPVYIANIISIRGIIAVVLYILFAGIILVLNIPNELKMLFIGGALWLFPHALNPDFAFQGLEKMYGVSISRTGLQLFFFLMVVILVHGRADLVQVPLYRSVGGAITVMILWIVLKKVYPVPLWRQRDPGQWKSFISVSAIMALSVGANRIYYTFDTIMLGLLTKSETVAWYNAAYKVILLFIGLAALIQFAFGPTFSRLRADTAVFQKYVRIFGLILGLSGTLATGVLIILNRMIIDLLFDKSYVHSADILVYLAFSLLVIYLVVIFLSPLLYSGYHKQYLYAVLFGAVTNVILNAFAIPIYGYLGAAAVTVFSSVVMLARGILYFHRYCFPVWGLLKNIFAILFIACSGFLVSGTVLSQDIARAVCFVCWILLIAGVIYRRDFLRVGGILKTRNGGE